MGISISSHVILTENEHLLRFVGTESIATNDEFWKQFLSYNINPPTTTNEQLAFESRIEPLCQTLLANNLQSGNIGALCDVFLIRVSELLASTVTDDDRAFSWQCFNALFALRSILKFLMELINEETLIEHIECGNDKSRPPRLESLINSLYGIVVDVFISDVTYPVHLEAVTTVLVLLSVQSHWSRRANQSHIFWLVMKGKNAIHAPVFMKSLLQNFLDQQKAPPGFVSNSQSIVFGIANELWSMLTFNRGRSGDISDADSASHAEYNEAPLSSMSLLLLLVLANNLTNDVNPYSQALFSCVNSQDNKPIQPISEPSSFKTDYNLLYTITCKKASSDSTTLLIYLLIHKNQFFRTYVLSRNDIDQLIVPILKTLYHAPNSNSHHIYMSLIILLILSEYQQFNRGIHENKLKGITWYTERILSEVTLGGLLVLVLIRTIQYNMLKMRDKYLHTNCLAALANMSDQFRNLHPYVSQRIVSLFETLAKRYHRLETQHRQQKEEHTQASQSKAPDTIAVDIPQNGTASTSVSVAVEAATDIEEDLAVVVEVLRMVLEILNSCLSSQLVHNPNLVYTLLYKREAFAAFRTHADLKDIVRNIDIIIGYYTDLLSSRQALYEVDAQQVLEIINSGAKHWPKNKLTKFPDLKFKYVEEEEPEEFFIPYVWALVGQLTTLSWSKESSPMVQSVC